MKNLKLLIHIPLIWMVNNKILFVIIVMAAALRFIGTSPGYQPFHPDEGMSYSSATSMIKNGNLDPLRYDYPSVIPLVNMLLFKIIFIPLYWAGFYAIHIPDFINGSMRFPLAGREYQTIFQNVILGWRDSNALAWGRIITALFGLGDVILVYLIAKNLFSKSVALLSASLVAVNYRQVLNSHLGLPDIYNAFFLMLAILSELSLLKKPTFKNYIISAFLIALSVSVKYQIFSLIPFLLIHLYLSMRRQRWQEKLRTLFDLKAVLVPVIIIAVFIILNPYHLSNLQKTITQVSYSAAKYQAGRMTLDFYSYWYLYEIGIGKITSAVLLLGAVVMLFKNFKKAIFLLSAAVPFMFMMTYYSFGGYYTRNFVTITPLLLIFAGYFISKIFISKILSSAPKILLIVILLPILWENFSNALIVPQEYSQSWNYRILAPWFSQNIPAGSRIAAHSSVFFPMEQYDRLPYNFAPAFSIDEFREIGADFAIANLDIATDDFYWWIGRIYPFKLWHKPVEILEQTYPAMAVRELSDFAVFSVINRWQAPDSDFIVAKIPEYKISSRKKMFFYSFDESDGWEKQGKLWYEDKNLFRKDGRLVIAGSNLSPVLRWESQPIFIDNWQGFWVEAKMESEAQNRELGNGFIFASFYASTHDAVSQTNRISVRLTSRNKIFNQVTQKNLVGEVPSGAKYMIMGFASYGPPDSTVYLDELTIYQAKVEVDYGGWKIKPLKIDPDILFPFSHGML